MTYLRALALTCVFALTACEAGTAPEPSPTTPQEVAEQPGPGDHRLDIQWNGKKRTFKVHAPPGYDGTQSLPLVVTMHFYPGDADGITTTSGMSAKADQENFLVLYPEGWAGGMNALVCCGSEDDVGLVRTLVERMVTRWKADPKRVYATGISNGGDMAMKLAVDLPGTFAAVAPVSGGLTGAKASDPSYKPDTPVSVIQFIGGLDRFHGQIANGIKQWQTRLSCTEKEADTLPNDIKLTVSQCADGSRVVVYELPHMGHSWPGAKEGGLSYPGAGISATDLMWEFFKVHTR